MKDAAQYMALENPWYTLPPVSQKNGCYSQNLQ